MQILNTTLAKSDTSVGTVQRNKKKDIISYITAGTIGAVTGVCVPVKPVEAEETVLKAGNRKIRARRLKTNWTRKSLFAIIGTFLGLGAIKLYNCFISKNEKIISK